MICFGIESTVYPIAAEHEGRVHTNRKKKHPEGLPCQLPLGGNAASRRHVVLLNDSTTSPAQSTSIQRNRKSIEASNQLSCSSRDRKENKSLAVYCALFFLGTNAAFGRNLGLLKWRFTLIHNPPACPCQLVLSVVRVRRRKEIKNNRESPTPVPTHNRRSKPDIRFRIRNRRSKHAHVVLPLQ